MGVRKYKFNKGFTTKRTFDIGEDNLEFAGVGPILYDPFTFNARRRLIYWNNIERCYYTNGLITDDHELWNSTLITNF